MNARRIALAAGFDHSRIVSRSERASGGQADLADGEDHDVPAHAHAVEVHLRLQAARPAHHHALVDEDPLEPESLVQIRAERTCGGPRRRVLGDLSPIPL